MAWCQFSGGSERNYHTSLQRLQPLQGYNHRHHSPEQHCSSYGQPNSSRPETRFAFQQSPANSTPIHHPFNTPVHHHFNTPVHHPFNTHVHHPFNTSVRYPITAPVPSRERHPFNFTSPSQPNSYALDQQHIQSNPTCSLPVNAPPDGRTIMSSSHSDISRSLGHQIPHQTLPDPRMLLPCSRSYVSNRTPELERMHLPVPGNGLSGAEARQHLALDSFVSHHMSPSCASQTQQSQCQTGRPRFPSAVQIEKRPHQKFCQHQQLEPQNLSLQQQHQQRLQTSPSGEHRSEYQRQEKPGRQSLLNEQASVYCSSSSSSNCQLDLEHGDKYNCGSENVIEPILGQCGTNVADEKITGNNKLPEVPESELKAAAEKDLSEIKQILTEEMLKSLERFDEMRHRAYIVPPIRTNNTKCRKLLDWSTRNSKVALQEKIQPAALLGNQTEDTVVKCLAEVVENIHEPMFVFPNYKFDDYLIYLTPKLVPKRNENEKHGQFNICTESIGSLSKDLLSAAHSADIYSTATSDQEQDPGLSSEDVALPYLEQAKLTEKNTSSGAEPPSSPASSPVKWLFPTTRDLIRSDQRGDFDVLMVSPYYGFIVIEAKTLLGSEEEQLNGYRQTVRKGLKQLQKDERVLRHLTSDLSEKVPITKLLALPNTSRDDLRRLLEDEELLQKCCEVLDTKTVEQIVSRCITSDLIDPQRCYQPSAGEIMPRDTTHVQLTPVMQWWRALVTDIQTDGKNVFVTQDKVRDENENDTMTLSWDVFRKIISRFCGPYSRVRCRTAADCIHLTGVDYGRSILRDDQLKILSSTSNFLFLVGPPGSGKTLLLAIKASEWARQPNHVVVVLCAYGVNAGSLVSWTLYDRVVQAVSYHKSREKRTTTSPETDNSRRRRNHCRHQRQKKKCQSDLQHKYPENQYPFDDTVIPESDLPDTEPTDHNMVNKSTVDNVHKAFITAEMDMDRFVANLLEQHSGAHLLVIVDECLGQYREDQVFKSLDSAQTSMDEIKVQYKRLTDLMVGVKKENEMSQESQTEARTGKLEETVPEDLLNETNEKTSEPNSYHTKMLNAAISLARNPKPYPQIREHEETHPGHSPMTYGSSSCGQSVSELNDFTGLEQGSRKQDNTHVHNAKQHQPPEIVTSERDYFTTMDHRMDRVSSRLQQLRADSGSGPRLLHSSRWRDAVDSLSRAFQTLDTLKRKAANAVLESPASCPLAVRDTLEEVSRLMVFAMGNLFLAYNSLNFFQQDQFFSTFLSESKRMPASTGKTLAVWSSTIHQSYIPAGYHRASLTCIIRCPPTVQKILKWTEQNQQSAAGYSYVTRGCDINPPLPSDGPPVTWFDHAPHMNYYKEVNDCSVCGKALADYLFDTLHLVSTTGKVSTEGQGHLRFHDVILCGSHIHQPNCPFIQELRERNISLQFENQTLTSPPPYTDNVFVAGGSTLQGLEAKIVVYVPELKRITEKEKVSLSASSSLASQAATVGRRNSDIKQAWMKSEGFLPLNSNQDSVQCGNDKNTTSGQARNDLGDVGQDTFKPKDREISLGSDLSSINQSCDQIRYEAENQSTDLNHQDQDQLKNIQDEVFSPTDGFRAGGWQRLCSEKDLLEQERLRRLGSWNRRYIWLVASRSLSSLILFHI